MYIIKRNILLSRDSIVKLADLGVAKFTQDTLHAHSLVGTRDYMSPEMWECYLSDYANYSFKTDIWFGNFNPFLLTCLLSFIDQNISFIVVYTCC